jgi:hypothetical protein
MKMSDNAKREPSIAPSVDRPSTYFPPPSPTLGPAPTVTAPSVPAPAISLAERGGLDQLSRIEEKSARIEEKFARSEALLLRVESTFQDAMTKFGGIARTTDINALEARMRRLPGAGTIFFVALLAALIGAVAVLVAQQHGIPGLLAPR